MELNKMKKGKEKEGRDKNAYYRWDLQMERALADVLRDQRSLGYKGDGGWKTSAFNTAASKLSQQFNKDVSVNNVKNCVKTWKRNYAIVSNILSQSGFNWDTTKNMLNIDEGRKWDEYVKSHEEAKSFRWKVIHNWDDILDLCGKDKATGQGVEATGDANEVMDDEEDRNIDQISDTRNLTNDDSMSSSSTGREKRRQDQASTDTYSKKRGENNVIAQAIMKISSTLEEYMKSKNQKLDASEVYKEINSIHGLDFDKKMKAYSWFIVNVEQFSMLKVLPKKEKKAFVLMFM